MSSSIIPKRVYIDTNVFIYLLEDTGDFGRVAEALFSHLRARAVPIVCSSLVYAECLTGARKRKNEALADIYKTIFLGETAPDIVTPTVPILERAAIISADYGLKLIDAIHVATAVETACTLLISNDGGIRVPPPLSLCAISTLRDQPMTDWPIG
ncbi:Predicted nucleic acid-binding protein, contains PIN domain [Rhizobium sp. RU20A]|uniref:type II toxin-antitoxin system VapC family toxin n=1 Tax=Rhizobium sp. RU20A TaxID=1907412 RepID=UPI00095722C4|nr:PIN domain-containing protein [Rhizobium sp. RU20A]SIR14741.1 Predicted nucleic acid-binding protein, contains PIN domain [Rhizobium sp. RU20A]